MEQFSKWIYSIYILFNSNISSSLARKNKVEVVNGALQSVCSDIFTVLNLKLCINSYNQTDSSYMPIIKFSKLKSVKVGK